MADGNSEGSAGTAAKSSIGLILGAILGVILSVAFGLITVGILKGTAGSGPGNSGAGPDQKDRKWEKHDFVIAPEKDEIKFNVAGTELHRRGMARCWIWYRTTDLPGVIRLLDSDKRRVDSLKMALKGFFAGKELLSFEGPEAMEALSEEARLLTQRILFPPGEDESPAAEVTDFFLDVMIQ